MLLTQPLVPQGLLISSTAILTNLTPAGYRLHFFKLQLPLSALSHGVMPVSWHSAFFLFLQSIPYVLKFSEICGCLCRSLIDIQCLPADGQANGLNAVKLVRLCLIKALAQSERANRPTMTLACRPSLLTAKVPL